MEKNKLLQWHFVRSCDATFLNPEDCKALSQSGKCYIFAVDKTKNFTAMLCNGQLELKIFIARALWGFS